MWRCTVLINDLAQRIWMLPVGAAIGQEVTTIEGLGGTVTEAVTAAWIEGAVPHCGYCKTVQIMAATGLLTKTSNPTDEEIADLITGNSCRCCTYQRINKAVRRAADKLA